MCAADAAGCSALQAVMVVGKCGRSRRRRGAARAVIACAASRLLVAPFVPSPVTINSIGAIHYGRSRSARDLCLPPSMRNLDAVRMKCHYRCIFNKEIVFNSQKLVKRR